MINLPLFFTVHSLFTDNVRNIAHSGKTNKEISPESAAFQNFIMSLSSLLSCLTHSFTVLVRLPLSASLPDTTGNCFTLKTYCTVPDSRKTFISKYIISKYSCKRQFTGSSDFCCWFCCWFNSQVQFSQLFQGNNWLNLKLQGATSWN